MQSDLCGPRSVFTTRLTMSYGRTSVQFKWKSIEDSLEENVVKFCIQSQGIKVVPRVHIHVVPLCSTTCSTTYSFCTGMESNDRQRYSSYSICTSAILAVPFVIYYSFCRPKHPTKVSVGRLSSG